MISVERQEFRNAYTTKIVRPAPKISASITLLRLSARSSPPSRVTSSLVPSGSVLLISSTSSRTRSATVTVLASRERMMDRPTFGWPLRRLIAGRLGEAVLDRGHLARGARSRCPARLTTMSLNSPGDSMRPDEADALLVERRP